MTDVNLFEAILISVSEIIFNLFYHNHHHTENALISFNMFSYGLKEMHVKALYRPFDFECEVNV